MASVISETAMDLLQEMDYDAKTLVDGMNGWSRVHPSGPVDIDIDGTLVQVARPGKGIVAGRIDVEAVHATLGKHVLPDAHERVLLPEGIFVDLSVVATFESKPLGDERLDLLPHLVGLFVYSPVPDVSFVERS